MSLIHARTTSLGALMLFCLCGRGVEAQALDEHSCRLEREGLPAAFGRCTTLTVPEDYARPEGPTLELFAARIPAQTATPAPDPLVLINGGPGGSTVDLYLQNRNAFAPILRDRDIVLLDQRGTGRSLSGLTCDVPDDLELETATPDELRAAVDDCIAEFPRDPRFFTTSVAVRDLETLRQALGADTVNLYGVSYGTRVAQHYLRRYPESVRAVILDGMVPAERVLGPDIASDAQAALDAVFARCAEDQACSEQFGAMPQKFTELRQRFTGDSVEVVINHPTTGEAEIVELGETQLQAVVRLMSYSDATVALLPLVIDEAYSGNFRPLATQAQLLIASIEEAIGFAMHNSVVCTEDVPFFGTTAADSDPYLGTTIVDGLRAICESWPSGVLDEDFREPVESDKPVLLLSGEHDPVTPPEYGTQVIAAGLTNTRHLIGRAKGHGLIAIGCMPRIARDFLQTATLAELDADCINDEPPMPFFLNFQGPAP